MDYRETAYYSAGRATDLEGKDRILYRFFEILPGAIAWLTLMGIVLGARYLPTWMSLFIIVFDVYWLLKTFYLSTYLRQNWKRLRKNMAIDWEKLISHLKYDHIYHVVLLPFYKESEEVIEKTVRTISETKYDTRKIIVVLASEERAGEAHYLDAVKVKERYESKFHTILITKHPANTPGEMPGKGSNIAYAAKQVKEIILDKQNMPLEDVLVSAFDIDTVPYSAYFQCLTWYFLTTENPHRASYQPVPFYHNNIWHAPAFSRVAAYSSTFWQMIQQERPERLATFSSHSMSFKALVDIGYWQKNMVSEDSRIFWNAYVAYNGDYRVIPISYPVSMDANLAPGFLETCKNIYKQHRRWGWGVENVPYLLMAAVKNKSIPLKGRFYMSLVQIEGFWSLATHPFIIFLLGWLPIAIGGREYNATVLSYNLPVITRYLMNVCMFGLVVSAVIAMNLAPQAPIGFGKKQKLFMVLQWILVPVTIIVFSALPGLEAQTRLMFGKYMGFWVTPKHRKA